MWISVKPYIIQRFSAFSHVDNNGIAIGRIVERSENPVFFITRKNLSDLFLNSLRKECRPSKHRFAFFCQE